MSDKPDNRPRHPFDAGYLGRLALPVLWAVIILWLSLTASPPSLPGFLGWDKLLHAAAYALLALLVAQYLQIHCADSRRACIYAACLAIGYGGLMEIMQLVVQTGRLAEWWDLAADVVGAVTGCVIFRQADTLLSLNHARNRTHG
jgi:VanZ family protein